jgi:multisubunit Na+/H+ antiporter MnhB subunit
MPGYPITPLVFLLLVSLLLVLLVGNNPIQALLGVAVVSSGIPIYYLVYRKRLVDQLASGTLSGKDD